MTELRRQSFVLFCQLVGFMLTVGQTAFARVAVDGLEVQALGAGLLDHARRIFSGLAGVPEIARDIVVVDKGRDAGFSRLGGHWGLWLGWTHPLGQLEPGEPAYVFFIAPKLRLARVPLRFALAAARRVPGLLIESEHTDGFTIIRHDGRRVIFECVAASRGGDTARGVPILFAMLDEAAFFRDEQTGVVNDRHVFNALVPRLIHGGQILIASSPWAESGLLYEEFTRNFGNPTTALAAHCPTLVMRDDPVTMASVERERERDAENARREFDAEFLPAGASTLFDSAALSACIDPSLPLIITPEFFSKGVAA